MPEDWTPQDLWTIQEMDLHLFARQSGNNLTPAEEAAS
jgi:hypothetical protein